MRLLAVSDAGQQAFLQSCDKTEPLCAEWVEFDALFRSSQTQRELPAARWASALPERREFCDVPVFYPFGGPDVTFPPRFFAACQVFVLAGLEPVGGNQLFGDLRQPANAAFVRAARSSLRSLLARGYFVTRYLERDLRPDRAGGVLPLLLMQLVRSGVVVRDIRVPEIQKDGHVRMAAFAPASRDLTAICILFSDAARPQLLKKIYYFRQDLSDGHFAGSAPGRLLRGEKRIRVLLKSASYLLHRPGFTELANLLLSKSEEIIQDDSGLPVAHFDSADWSIRGFGTYGPLLPEFREFYQPALAKLSQSAAPLVFNAGYRGSVMLHIIRKD